MIDNKAASKGKPSKSGTDLPDIETIHVRNGKAELSLTHTEAENVAACLYKVITSHIGPVGQIKSLDQCV